MAVQQDRYLIILQKNAIFVIKKATQKVESNQNAKYVPRIFNVKVINTKLNLRQDFGEKIFILLIIWNVKKIVKLAQEIVVFKEIKVLNVKNVIFKMDMKKLIALQIVKSAVKLNLESYKL